MNDETKSREQELQELKQQPTNSIHYEFFQFVWENKTWWIAPIIVVTLLTGLLVFLGGSGAAPFIYSLF